MGLYDGMLRKLLFRMDPERAHNLAFWFIQRGLVGAKLLKDPRLEQTLFGTTIPNPLGLAAGFDKNAQALGNIHRLGFGFAEVGTITHHPQPGNPKPRMFRLPKERALINRLGFNNLGAQAAATRLANTRSQIPFGVNLGKSKVTPNEEAAADYAASFRLLHSYGAYTAINVSSPNTPGLRALQEKGPLIEIISTLKQIDPDKPLLLKVAPDLLAADLDQIVTVAHEMRIAGLIATNTTISREGVSSQESGGLSGKPLWEMANAVLSYLRKSCDPSMVLVGVGGIFSGEDLYQKLGAGASLCQVYTGWIYGGPSVVPKSLAGLLAKMDKEGFSRISDIRS